jgi:anti-anti-sigma factor
VRQLSINVRETEGAILIALSGELDISEVDRFVEVLAAAEAKRPTVLVIDLRGLQFMDSSGIRVMVEADLRAREAGRRLIIVRGPDAVHRVFTIALLEKRLEFVDEPPAELPDGPQG